MATLMTSRRSTTPVIAMAMADSVVWKLARAAVKAAKSSVGVAVSPKERKSPLVLRAALMRLPPTSKTRIIGRTLDEADLLPATPEITGERNAG